MFELLGLCLFLAALLTLNAITAAGATFFWWLLETRAQGWAPPLKAQRIFILRVAPMVISLGLVLALVLPAYLINEPRHTVEPVSAKLALLTGIAALGLCLALWRGLNSWLVTRRLVQNWLQHATRMEIDDLAIPAFRIAHPMPVVAVVGFWRPRLFLAEQLLAILSPAELRAAIAHEKGHLRSRDNLKRAILRACCDVMAIFPCGRFLDRMWASAAEAAADEYAARSGQNVAVELASALLKIARLIPAGGRVALPIGASFIGQNPAELATRVQSLLHFSSLREETPSSSRVWAIAFYGSLVVAGIISLIIGSTAWLQTVHEISERVISCLQ